MTNADYLKLIANGEFRLSIGDRVEYNGTRTVSTGEIVEVNGERYSIRYDDGTYEWRGRDNITYTPTAERIATLAAYYRETNHQRGGSPEFRLGAIRECTSRIHRKIVNRH